MSSYSYVCPHTTHMCPHTTICILIPLDVCPHTTIQVSSYSYMRPHTAIHVSSYYYISVLRAHEAQQDPALYMYAKLPTIYVSACYYICVLDMCPHTAI